MTLAPKRYAEALLQLARVSNKVSDFRTQLAYISELYESSEDVKNFFLNPLVGTAPRKNIITQLFSSNVDKELINMLFLLVDKEMFSYLPNLYTEYKLLADKYENTLNLKITAASPLDDVQLLRLKEKYRIKYEASYVNVETVIDPSLIGGVSVQIGDKVYDGSLKGRLESLKDILIEK